MSLPVRITFTMRTPVIVPSGDKSLDALLSWAAVQQADFAGAHDPVACQHNTGLAKHHVADQWCFMASNLTYEWASEPDQVHYIKRQRMSDYACAWGDGLLSNRPQFDAQRGFTKAGSYLQPMRWAKTITGFAMVEERGRVQELLPWITHIGKLRHKDFGAVRSFAMIDDPAAAQEWARRNLPVLSPFATRHRRGVGALVSPAWLREKHLEVAISNE